MPLCHGGVEVQTQFDRPPVTLIQVGTVFVQAVPVQSCAAVEMRMRTCDSVPGTASEAAPEMLMGTL